MHGLKNGNGVTAARLQNGSGKAVTHHQPSWTAFVKPPLALQAELPKSQNNQLLAHVPEEEMARLSPLLEPVTLARQEDVRGYQHGDHFVYFPQNAVISHLSVFKNGSTAEVALIGSEGMVGLSTLFDARLPEQWARVSVAGSALRVKAATLKQEFARGGALQQLLLQYTGAYVKQVAQRAVCNGQHKIEERLAVWLLLLHDRVRDDLLPLTHEQIARRLGTRRSSITLAAVALQERGIISYVRGRIRVLERQALEQAACECYEVISFGPEGVISV
jgi:CRP-like cAMP-binding protein